MARDIKVGLIARADLKSGLGAQCYRLAKMIKPDEVMLIDSTSFNGNQQYPEVYKNCFSYINGFPTPTQIAGFCKTVDVVISCETFYSYEFIDIARANNTKTILIFNYEFLDNLNKPSLPLPDKLIQPSWWYFKEMKARFNAEYLPTPIFDYEFRKARRANLKRVGSPRYLFLNGKTAIKDRQGLQTLYEALQLAKGDFTITIKSQSEIPKHPDPRIIYDYSNPYTQDELYKGFDCLIHPRRYAGQSMVMCEALQSALPVIMLDREPDNMVLPKEWLLPCKITDTFMARTEIDVYSADPQALANILDNMDLGKQQKLKALEIGKQYDAEVLRPQYEKLLESV